MSFLDYVNLLLKMSRSCNTGNVRDTNISVNLEKKTFILKAKIFSRPYISKATRSYVSKAATKFGSFQLNASEILFVQQIPFSECLRRAFQRFSKNVRKKRGLLYELEDKKHFLIKTIPTNFL